MSRLPLHLARVLCLVEEPHQPRALATEAVGARHGVGPMPVMLMQWCCQQNHTICVPRTRHECDCLVRCV